MESPLEDPPHADHEIAPVITLMRGIVPEISLVPRYPPVRLLRRVASCCTKSAVVTTNPRLGSGLTAAVNAAPMSEYLATLCPSLLNTVYINSSFKEGLDQDGAAY